MNFRGETHSFAQHGTPSVSSTTAASVRRSESGRRKHAVQDHTSDRSLPSSFPKEGSGKDESANARSTLLLWKALSLRRPVLLGFTGLFILMIISLEIMYFFSRRDDGLATVAQKEHYLWTYGPTFILTIVAALWSQAEFQTKQTMPWVEMKHGQAKAEKSMLLNYTTAPTHEAIYTSLKLGHYSVTLAISGTLILRLLIIASTGLLSLEYRDMERPGSFAVLDTFDFMRNNGTPAMMAGPRYWAIHEFNSTYPAGTTEEFSTQSFAPLEQVANGTVATELDVFSAELDCEPLEWEYSPSFNQTKIDIPPEYYNQTLPISAFPPACAKTDLTSASCSVRDFCFAIDQIDLGSTQERVYGVDCSNGTEIEEPHRILIYYGEMGAAVRDEEGLRTLGPPHIDYLVGIICKPKYTMSRRRVSNSTQVSDTNKLVGVSRSANGSLPLGAATADITASMIQSMNGEFVALADGNEAIGGPITLWFSLLSAADPQTPYDAFNETGLIGNVSQRAFPAFAQQWAKSAKMAPANQTVSGTITETKERLCVQELALRLMEGFLAVLILASAALSFSHYLTGEDSPESLLSNALMLARSPGLEGVLGGAGVLPEKELKNTIQDRNFWTPGMQSVTRSGIVVDPSDAPKTEASAPQPSMWQPMTSTWAFRIPTIATPILLVIALEVLYQYSSRHNGIADVSTDDYTKYAWVFVPSLTLSLVALTFSMLDFSARLMHPYQELWRGGASVKTLIFEPLGKPTLVALFQTFRQQKFALFAILLTSIIGPILTIVTSGLYAAEPVPLSRVVPVLLNDWYDFSADRRDLKTEMRISVSSQDVTIADLIAFDNVSFPQWTYDELAFPTFHIDADAVADFATNTSDAIPLTARLPAVRANMNCTLNRFLRDVNITWSSDGVLEEPLMGTVEPAYPPGCSRPRTSTNGSTTRSGVFFPRLIQDDPSDGFFAYVAQDLEMLDVANATTGETAAVPWAFCDRADRQHWWFMVGTQAGAVTREMALLHCEPFIEVLHADARFAYPSFALDASSSSSSSSSAGAPPAPVEGTSRFLSRNDSALEKPIYNAPMTLLLAAAATGNVSAANAGASNTIDPFFEALVFGRDGVPAAELVGERGAPRLVEAMRRQYARVAAQTFRFAYRSEAAAVVPTASPGAADGSPAAGTTASLLPAEAALLANLTATVEDDRSRLRLVQSPVSTRLLEALLLLMAACAVASLALARGAGRILPKEPGSVASKMSLLAGSRLVDVLRDAGVATESEAERKLQADEVGLGWWDMAGGGRRRFGVDVGVAGRRQ